MCLFLNYGLCHSFFESCTLGICTANSCPKDGKRSNVYSGIKD